MKDKFILVERKTVTVPVGKAKKNAEGKPIGYEYADIICEEWTAKSNNDAFLRINRKADTGKVTMWTYGFDDEDNVTMRFFHEEDEVIFKEVAKELWV